MRSALALAAVFGCALVLTGCQITLQNDNLVHAVYDCPCSQAMISLNDATDLHACADTQLARGWAEAMDVLGADGYHAVHHWLNQPDD